MFLRILSSHNVTVKKPDDGNYVVKVRYTFNFALSVPRGSSYATLIDKISEKIKVAPSAVTLR